MMYMLNTIFILSNYKLKPLWSNFWLTHKKDHYYYYYQYELISH